MSPKVGQRGSRPSQSNSQTGKLDSIPPSTIRCSSPVLGLVCSTGSKKNGIDMLMRTA